MKIESLAYTEFYKLSDNAIRKADVELLLDYTLETQDERNFKLATIVKNYPGDSKQINNPEFDRKYKELRQSNFDEQILFDYSKIVGEFHRK